MCKSIRPEQFNDIAEVRSWVDEFVHWYNEIHKHSRIKFVSPSQRHRGLDKEILAKRYEVLAAAKAKNPLRWSTMIQNCKPIGAVTLNPEKIKEDAA